MTKNMNIKHDRRHKLGRSVKTPNQPHEVSVVRCLGCRRLLTEHECRVKGMCPTCHGHRFQGAYPSPWEMVRIQLLNVIQRWEIHGERGWGWNRAKAKANS